MQRPIDQDLIEMGRETIAREMTSLEFAKLNIDNSFAEAVWALATCTGKIIVSGLGKSGHVGSKIAATLSSTGSPAFFLHASEALHGDFGVFAPGDCLLAIAYGGETREVLAVVKFARKNRIPVIALTGKQDSTLAAMSDFIVNGAIVAEADPLGLAPTASSTVAMALGDALAVALMRTKGITHEKFAELHPGGSLGRSLVRVKDCLRPSAGVLTPTSSFTETLEAVTEGNFGVAAVLQNEQLCGVISDGDLRRALTQYGKQALDKQAQDLMTGTPKVVALETRIQDAIRVMEHSKVTSLFVLDHREKLCGVIRLHDLLENKII